MLASLSCIACLLLGKQSGITARNNFSFQALVLPVKDGLSLKVFIITVCFQRRVFISLSRANKITHFYCLHKRLHYFQKTREIELQHFKWLFILNRWCVTNNMQIRSEPSLVRLVMHCNFWATTKEILWSSTLNQCQNKGRCKIIETLCGRLKLVSIMTKKFWILRVSTNFK